MAIATSVESWPEEILAQGRHGGIRYELVDGQILEKPPLGSLVCGVATDLIFHLMGFARSQNLGRCFTGECVYQIFPQEPHRVRRPDGTFLRAGRLAGGKIPLGNMKIVPDLAFEVLSTHDLAENVVERVEDLLGAGVPLLWVIFTNTRSVMVYRPGGACTRLGEGDALDGEGVLPGSRCPLADRFAAL